MTLRLRRCPKRLVLPMLGGALLAAVALPAARFLRTAWHVAQAREHLDARRPSHALEQLQAAERLDSDRAETHFLLARTFRRLGRLDLVRDEIERAWKLGYPLEELRREQWLAQAQAGQLKDAEPHLRELLTAPGDDGPEICEAFVNGYFRTYHFGLAFSILDAWQADYPEDPQPHVFRGIYWQHANQFPKAVAAFRRALEQAPERCDVRVRLAQSLVELHEYDQAAQHFQQCLQPGNGDPIALAGLAWCRMAQQREDEARRLFQQLLREDPDHFEGRLGMGKLELLAGRAEQALDWLRPAAEERPFDVQTRYALASALSAIGEAEAARRHFDFVSEAEPAGRRIRALMDEVLKRPQDADLRYQIGTTILKYGPPWEGAAWLQSVLDVSPDHVPTHRALAEYYAQRGQHTRAERHRRQAAAAPP